MSNLAMRILRHHGVTRSVGTKLRLKMICVAPLHTSLESSVQLLLQNRPDDVVSCFKERGDKDMDDLHPLEKNVYALGLLFSGDTKQSLAVQTQVLMTQVHTDNLFPATWHLTLGLV